MSAKKLISLDVVKQHNKPDDLWLVIEDKIYNITDFRSEHPGGEEPLDEAAGKDATKEFLEVGHSNDARKLMEKYYIGDLDKTGLHVPLVEKFGVAIACAVIGVAAGLLLVKYVGVKK